MNICKTPQRFHRLSNARPFLYALLFIAWIVLASCRTSSSSSIVGTRGVDSLLEDDSYGSIAQGAFLMGSPAQKTKTSRRNADEHPQRRVLITKPFEMGKYEVTQDQWQAVMNSNPSSFKGPKLPVTNVSWNDAQEFIAR